MTMHQRSTAFPLFSSLPAELRLMVFEQALLPLIEPRIIEVYASTDNPYPGFYLSEPLSHLFSFSAYNTRFLREIESFVTSVETLSQVCRESRDAVRAFHRRHGQLEPQQGFSSTGLTGLPLRIPLRPQGPDIFFWRRFRLLETQGGMSPWSAAGRDLERAKRWLVPVDALLRDLDEMEVGWDHHTYDWRLAWGHSHIKNPLLMSPHDIIALVPANDAPTLLRYSDLIIVSADASREMAIPGLEDVDRNFILARFAYCKESLRRFETQEGQRGLVPVRVFPDLYFAYVNPLKRGNPYARSRSSRLKGSQ